MISVKKRPGFPHAVLDFRNYTPARALGLLLLLLNLAYLGFGLGNYWSWTEQWWRPDSALKAVYLGYHLLLFVIVTGICWLVYDRRRVEGYILSFFSLVFGILYLLSPIDMVPDMVPVAGQADDLVVSGSSITLGLIGWIRNMLKNARARRIVRLIDQGSHEEALARFLENEGYQVERKKEDAAAEG